jgi:hypothetical protein
MASSNYIIKCSLDKTDNGQLIKILWSIGRELISLSECDIFIPINRSIENRIDLYLFDSNLSKESLLLFIQNRKISNYEISQIDYSPELLLVKKAAEVVEILLKYFTKGEIYNKLFSEHFHYIFNGLGCSYTEESKIYHQAYNYVSKMVKK